VVSNENVELTHKDMEQYYSCCGKCICKGCVYSFIRSGNNGTCPYCKSERDSKTDEDLVEELMKRVDVNDANAMYLLGNHYQQGLGSFRQDRTKAVELWKQAAGLGCSKAHFQLCVYFDEEGDSKKEKFHLEAGAMAGHDLARSNLGIMEVASCNTERAVKHWVIAASVGNFYAMHNLQQVFEKGYVSRDLMDSTLTAYNNSCLEMRSEARDAYVRFFID
jgi:TPR repeat protein